MNKDFDDIKRILNVCNTNPGLIPEIVYCLESICEETDDIYRTDKHEYFKANVDSLVDEYSNVAGVIYPICKKKKCSECIINKWCNHYRNNMQKKEAKRKGFTYADFFCGSGGLSLGFHNAGFKLSLANDIQSCCIDTIALNHPEAPGQHIIADDINNVISNIKNISRYADVDVVIGGPPCQGFSMANRQRVIDDPRNHLYKSFIRALDVLKPKFFVMENVRGMLNVKKQIQEDFEAIGYNATAYLLNAKDYGIPQNRERVIFIGNCIGVDNEILFEKIKTSGENKNNRVLEDALFGLPELCAKTKKNATEEEDEKTGFTISSFDSYDTNEFIEEINFKRNIKLLFNHKARYNNERDIEIFSRLNQGDNSADSKIQDIMPYKRREKIFKDKYFKLEMKKVCKTITAHMKYDCNMYIHPTQARGLTPREAARVQTYPDDYFFRGSYTKTYMQVGNSVPPLLSYEIAKVIKDYLEEMN